ncbi:MAG: SRPBCC family protein [Ilumatobacteraceae bacterium]
MTVQSFDVPSAALFAVLAEPGTYPRWLVGAKRIREVTADWPSAGSSFKHVVGFGPLAIPDRTTVRAIEAPLMLELLVRARPLLAAVVRYEVEDLGSGCKLRMNETPVGIYKFIAPVARPLIRRRNERSLRRLLAVVSSATRAV